MTDWRIRPAMPADGAALIALEARAFGPASWGGNAIAEGLSQRFVSTLIASDAGGACAGFAMWRRIADEAEILSLGVLPERRRAGCARTLLAGVIDAARGEGLRSLFLEADAGNVAAIGLYVALAFRRIARRQRYYKSGADALVMRLDL